MNMTDEEAVYEARSLSSLQRQVLLQCSKERWVGLDSLAERYYLPLHDLKHVGNYLESANYVEKEPSRRGGKFASHMIKLNDRGEQVRAALSALPAESTALFDAREIAHIQAGLYLLRSVFQHARDAIANGEA
jgi:DNA-binding MarR family transcriptional regulator